ncbi:TIGR03086 family metal-binding protein [Streptacidiphilus sp. ASG 303]|uniref:TIGR03086 family metal-binding protein n=1 Tax=Streptacidiphilus sp. ASG 303 TaxID=2896847 RepID=UPI001E64AA51|nr:TIGR03086 family metal-binding protein [Streptacidiphilus sp. ASG 303]MCD0484528.1 TIGR03086 family metal-binding protein [Streptacidiphilus sp. ASG 303]
MTETTGMTDLGPAALRMADLLDGVADGQLARPTPCEEYTLGDLADHVGGLALAFTAAAAKDRGEATARGGTGDAARLGPDWRTRTRERLAALAEAWRSPAAWEGTTRVGGVDLPGAVAGRVALGELVVHGWDVARASGQPFACDRPALDAALWFVSQSAGPGREAGRAGVFGPAVPVPRDAPPLDRLIALSGRAPSWSPPE